MKRNVIDSGSAANGKHLAVLLSFSGQGGVERMMTHLLHQFVAKGYRVDVLLIRAEGPHVQNLPAEVNRIPLPTRHTLTNIPAIAAYLRRARPDALLAAKDRAGRAAVRARWLAGVPTRLVVRLGTNLSEALNHKDPVSRWLRVAPMRRLYRRIDRVIAVSDGVREDTLTLTGLSGERVTTVRNPVVSPQLLELSQGPAPHPWLAEKRGPVILGAGRLSEQKDFPTLLRAFAALPDRAARLILIGEGKHRDALLALAEELGIAERLLLPGFQSNPYVWMRHADLFVLSSRWEGSPNVLTEALALGVPSVSTRCPSGPNEVLAEGHYGPLVEVGDVAGLSAAMQATLAAPLPATELQEAVREYHADISAATYLKLLFGH